MPHCERAQEFVLHCEEEQEQWQSAPFSSAEVEIRAVIFGSSGFGSSCSSDFSGTDCEPVLDLTSSSSAPRCTDVGGSVHHSLHLRCTDAAASVRHPRHPRRRKEFGTG